MEYLIAVLDFWSVAFALALALIQPRQLYAGKNGYEIKKNKWIVAGNKTWSFFFWITLAVAAVSLSLKYAPLFF
ncbi:hypothetical protein [Rhizobium bangladeshense]|uniref:hypothetical protein n=1 Tax=Rhizobium bangladeshense TaxID=1138189 RepID=UPI001C82C948|nr:hypothetical protein [Rhizobium bangladeshense]MBX4889790.1 hypothetical protein [Rhizobium bangladeshense]